MTPTAPPSRAARLASPRVIPGFCQLVRHQVTWLIVLVSLAASSSVVRADDPDGVGAIPGLEVPDGFEVSLFADDELAHNIYSLAIDPQGRIVVSGPGYIRRLVDGDGDGRAERAETFSEIPATGAQGMCFVGNDLVCTGDGALLCLRDRDGDGLADGAPERWTRLANSEHGAHAILQGPDGWLYVICGNDAGVSRDHVGHVGSPIQAPYCGAILRVSPDGTLIETIADGFRNPYDLAFNSAGQMFTVDSDGERDHHLPWYAPTRLFDVAQGRSHGWMNRGYQSSWNRPESFADSVDRAAELGRGSPTGLVSYQHRTFPDRYRDGLFSACWTLGRIYFLPLEPHGATYRSEPELFMRTTGHVGFAPCDLEIGPNGDLFVAIGGRHTRGGVFRIRYVSTDVSEARDNPAISSDDPLKELLDAPMPLSAWSRKKWVPAAQAIGPDSIVAATLDTRLSTSHRVRAIEILVELFDGLPVDVARNLVTHDDALVVARMAWAIGIRTAAERLEALRLLAGLTDHRDPRVSRAAWEGLARQKALPRDLDPMPHWLAGLASADRRVRGAAISCAVRAGRVNFSETMRRAASALREFSFADRVRLAELWIERPPIAANRDWSMRCMQACRQVFDESSDAVLRLEAVRLMQVALGDVKLGEVSAELNVGYEAIASDAVPEPLRAETALALAGRFPTGNAELDREIARLLALLAVEVPLLPDAISTRWTPDSSVPDDLHYLMVLAQLPGKRDPHVSISTADALLTLDAKLAAEGLFVSRNWPQCVEETFDRLAARDTNLVEAMIADAEFGRAAHSLFVRRMSEDHQKVAASRMLEMAATADRDDATVWTSELINVLSGLPPSKVFPVLRGQWENLAVRDALVVALAQHAEPVDRQRFVEALASPQVEVMEAASGALLRLDSPGTAAEIAQAIVALRQLSKVASPAVDIRPMAGALGKATSAPFRRQRSVLTALLRHWTGADPAHDLPTDNDAAPSDDKDEGQNDVAGADATNDPQAVLKAWTTWFEESFPDDINLLSIDAGKAWATWQLRLTNIDWDEGDAARGARVFERTSCHRCHLGTNRLGPDLAGAADRLSREDLFAAIVDPSRDVSPLYRSTLVATSDGNLFNGLVVYDSPEGLLLQTGPDSTIRITGESLSARQTSSQSLMPTGLLDSLSNADAADLYAYLKTIQPR